MTIMITEKANMEKCYYFIKPGDLVQEYNIIFVCFWMNKISYYVFK